MIGQFAPIILQYLGQQGVAGSLLQNLGVFAGAVRGGDEGSDFENPPQGVPESVRDDSFYVDLELDVRKVMSNTAWHKPVKPDCLVPESQVPCLRDAVFKPCILFRDIAWLMIALILVLASAALQFSLLFLELLPAVRHPVLPHSLVNQ